MQSEKNYLTISIIQKHFRNKHECIISNLQVENQHTYNSNLSGLNRFSAIPSNKSTLANKISTKK